jgi:hypothetical protein
MLKQKFKGEAFVGGRVGHKTKVKNGEGLSSSPPLSGVSKRGRTGGFLIDSGCDVE